MYARTDNNITSIKKNEKRQVQNLILLEEYSLKVMF